MDDVIAAARDVIAIWESDGVDDDEMSNAVTALRDACDRAEHDDG